MGNSCDGFPSVGLIWIWNENHRTDKPEKIGDPPYPSLFWRLQAESCLDLFVWYKFKIRDEPIPGKNRFADPIYRSRYKYIRADIADISVLTGVQQCDSFLTTFNTCVYATNWRTSFSVFQKIFTHIGQLLVTVRVKLINGYGIKYAQQRVEITRL
jgi:hypothetical protein